MDLSASTALQQVFSAESARPSHDVANDNIEVLSHDLVTWHNVDHQVDAVTFVERMLGDAVIAKQSEMVAHKLSAAGFDPYLKSDDTVSMVGLISGTVIGLSKYRNLNIIPEVAQRNRLVSSMSSSCSSARIRRSRSTPATPSSPAVLASRSRSSRNG